MNNSVRVPVSSPHMIAEIDGPIGWMIFNKPDRRNAVSLDMWEAIPEILQRFEADPSVRVVVLRGAGDKAFVSGADISQFEKSRSTEDGNAHYDRISGRADQAIGTCGKPTIAMIGGYCIGGGLGIAVGCDIRIASDDSKFGIPGVASGRWIWRTGSEEAHGVGRIGLYEGDILHRAAFRRRGSAGDGVGQSRCSEGAILRLTRDNIAPYRR